MISTQDVLVQTENGVCTISLNRTEKHNAFNDVMIRKLTQVIRHAIDDPLANMIVLRSTGEHFSAGADLNWMASLKDATLEENLEDAKALAQLMFVWYNCPKPTISLVNGSTFGGGIGLVAASHIVIAADNARFCFSEVKLGLIPAVITPYVINAIGNRAARFYYLTAQVFDAKKAKEMGLCHEIVAPTALDEALKSTLTALKQHGPIALRETNIYLNQFHTIKITTDMINLTSEKIAKLRRSNEGQEGMRAFLEKRRPNWIK